MERVLYRQKNIFKADFPVFEIYIILGQIL